MVLQQFITERLKITSSTKSVTLRPTTKEELKDIIEHELDKQGPDADLNFIDVSGITDMSNLFVNMDKNISNLIKSSMNIRNIKIDQWDVSNVKDMSMMFYGCENFNCDLSKWDVSNVYNMRNMFEECSKFNSDLSKWDVSNVTSGSKMFFGCSNFNCDLSSWDVSNMTHMSFMFCNCNKFAGNGLDKWGTRVYNVEYLSGMFMNCENLDVDLSSWKISKIYGIGSMFEGCKKFKSDLSHWDCTNVKYRDDRDVFKNCPNMLNNPQLQPKFA